jgi:hypothetical protein
MTMEELAAHFRLLEGCCLHQPVWKPDDADEVLFAIESGDGEGWKAGWYGGSEYSVYVVVRLKESGYGLLHSQEDYTGHGCECGAFTGRYDHLSKLFRDGILPEMYL